MAIYTGEATIRLTNVEAKDEEELTKALTWLMPVIAAQMTEAMSKAPKPKADLSIGAMHGAGGPSASVSISGNVGGGTVSAGAGYSPGGGATGFVGGTWKL